MKHTIGMVNVDVTWTCDCGATNVVCVDSDYFERGPCCRTEYCYCEAPNFSRDCKCGKCGEHYNVYASP